MRGSFLRVLRLGPCPVLALLCLTGGVRAQELWGELEPGPFAVGFRSEWVSDPARTFAFTFADGERYAAQGEGARPILVNAWYPAQADEGAPMAHGEYLEILSTDPALERLSLELASYARGVMAEYTVGKPEEQLDEGELACLEELLQTPTACVRDAEPADGRFPLVLYHSGYGSSFEDNSVLCEYLASHGYVVLGSAYLAEAGGSFNIDGKEGSGRDFAFLVRHASGWASVDVDRVGLIGHSGGAHAVLGYQAQPATAVDAVVSLDTTQDYVSALDPHWLHSAKMLANVEAQRTPLLVVANSHAFFQLCDSIVHADRTYLTFRELDHNDYTVQGVLLAENQARLAHGGAPGATEEFAQRAQLVRRGFEQCTQYVRLFLDEHLAESEEACLELETRYLGTPMGGVEPHVERVPAGVAGPEPYDLASGVPPTPRQARRLLDELPAEEALALFERIHASDPEAPIFEGQFQLHVLLDLVARGHADVAGVLAPFFAGLHPDLVGTLLWWVGRSDGERYRDYRVHALRTILLLEPEHDEATQALVAEER